MSWQHTLSEQAVPGHYFTWNLERPRPALPHSYFWTWDHSTNWFLDDPGLQNRGCYNTYLKHRDAYLEDYRRLTDLAAGLGIDGIVIWGFLRDAHGGVEYGKRLADYARERGVAIMPGVGTTWYGGIYYEGEHPYNLEVFLRKYPEARMLGEDGQPRVMDQAYGACPAHPAYQDWLQESLHWLYREFEIGGINLENGDMLVDYHPLTQAARARWPAHDPEEFFFQGLSYSQALNAIADKLPDTLGTYATYTGFQYGDRLEQNTGMGRTPPAMLDILPAEGICQWTLTGMVLEDALPLTAYLDDGAPAAAFDNPNWPQDLRPPGKRHVGFVHQGSQWSRIGRYECIVSTIKEACLRAYRSGLEGVAIHGEVTGRWIPAALNYLAFSHFIHWPEDTIRDFGRKTLSQVLGTEEEGETFAEILSHRDAGTLTADHRKQADPACHGFTGPSHASICTTVEQLQRYHFWAWLASEVQEDGRRDPGVLMI